MPTIIPPTRSERILRAISYLLLGLLGAWSVYHAESRTAAPLGMSAALGYALTLTWAILMSTALVAAVASFRGRFRVEYAALPWFGTAIITATMWLWVWVVAYPSVIGTALLSTSYCVQLAQRYLTLQKLVRGGNVWSPPPSSN